MVVKDLTRDVILGYKYVFPFKNPSTYNIVIRVVMRSGDRKAGVTLMTATYAVDSIMLLQNKMIAG